jgi:hypothetical protein
MQSITNDVQTVIDTFHVASQQLGGHVPTVGNITLFAVTDSTNLISTSLSFQLPVTLAEGTQPTASALTEVDVQNLVSPKRKRHLSDSSSSSSSCSSDSNSDEDETVQIYNPLALAKNPVPEYSNPLIPYDKVASLPESAKKKLPTFNGDKEIKKVLPEFVATDVPFQKFTEKEKVESGFKYKKNHVKKGTDLLKSEFNTILRIMAPYNGDVYDELDKNQRKEFLIRATYASVKIRNYSVVGKLFVISSSTLRKRLMSTFKTIKKIASKTKLPHLLLRIGFNEMDYAYLSKIQNREVK